MDAPPGVDHLSLQHGVRRQQVDQVHVPAEQRRDLLGHPPELGRVHPSLCEHGQVHVAVLSLKVRVREKERALAKAKAKAKAEVRAKERAPVKAKERVAGGWTLGPAPTPAGTLPRRAAPWPTAARAGPPPEPAGLAGCWG